MLPWEDVLETRAGKLLLEVSSNTFREGNFELGTCESSWLKWLTSHTRTRYHFFPETMLNCKRVLPACFPKPGFLLLAQMGLACSDLGELICAVYTLLPLPLRKATQPVSFFTVSFEKYLLLHTRIPLPFFTTILHRISVSQSPLSQPWPKCPVARIRAKESLSTTIGWLLCLWGGLLLKPLTIYESISQCFTLSAWFVSQAVPRGQILI